MPTLLRTQGIPTALIERPESSVSNEDTSIPKASDPTDPAVVVYLIAVDPQRRLNLAALFAGLRCELRLLAQLQPYRGSAASLCHVLCLDLARALPGAHQLVRVLPRQPFVPPVVVFLEPEQADKQARLVRAGAEFFCFGMDVALARKNIQRAVARARKSYMLSQTRIDVHRRFTELTNRERQVHERLVRGFNSRQIGEELNISPKTVDVFRSKIFSKMGAQSVVHLVRQAYESGLCESDVFVRPANLPQADAPAED